MNVNCVSTHPPLIMHLICLGALLVPSSAVSYTVRTVSLTKLNECSKIRFSVSTAQAVLQVWKE